jgi:hypothetical protein
VSVVVVEPADSVTLDGLEDELARAFSEIRDAVERGDPVVVALDDAHVQGVGDTAGVALTHGLLGMARAFAVEGRKPGWRVSVLSSAAGVDVDERDRWVAQLAESPASSGALVRLGGEHLGKLPT